MMRVAHATCVRCTSWPQTRNGNGTSVSQVDGPSASSWEGAEARLQAASAAAGASDPGSVCVALFAAPGVDSSKQGAALPGMAIAALLAALEACGCAKEVQTDSSVVQEALRPFGFAQS